MIANMQKKGMPYARLGNSGLKVSKIILGCMPYGTPEWRSWVLTEEESIKLIKAAYDGGINTFDTANVYSNGESERILGKAIKQFNLPREEIVVMTKLHGVVGKAPSISFMELPLNPDEVGYVNQHGLSRKHIFDSVKLSLERLQLDYVDLLQCDRFDNNTPIAETMQALHDIVKAGYARYIGMSSCWAWQFHAMQSYAIANKLTPFISMQNHYNVVYREEEREMMPTLKYFGVGSIPWSTLGRGLLTQPLPETIASITRIGMVGEYCKASSTETIINRVEEIAKKRGISMTHISLAWILQKDGVSAAIAGSVSMEHLQQILASVHVQLSPEEVKYLEEPYVPQSIIGHT